MSGDILARRVGLRRAIHSDGPFGGWRGATGAATLQSMLEISLVILSLLCFAVLDLYVAGCERV